MGRMNPSHGFFRVSHQRIEPQEESYIAHLLAATNAESALHLLRPTLPPLKPPTPVVSMNESTSSTSAGWKRSTTSPELAPIITEETSSPPPTPPTAPSSPQTMLGASCDDPEAQLTDIQPLVAEHVPSGSGTRGEDEMKADREHHSGTSCPTLHSVLTTGELENIAELLKHDFDEVAEGEYSWLLELRDHGYTVDEIAQLLMDERRYSPWIIPKARPLPEEQIIPDHHQPFCVHTAQQGPDQSNQRISTTLNQENDDQLSLTTSNDDSLSLIEELCGLAGVMPHDNESEDWLGSVRFESQDGALRAYVSIASQYVRSQSDDEKELQTMSTICATLENVCYGIGHAQRVGFCCNSFTFLYLRAAQSGLPVIELCSIDVATIESLFRSVSALHENIKAGYIDFNTCIDALLQDTGSIFQAFAVVDFPARKLSKIIDYVSLAAQFTSLAFTSYLKAHIGPFQPFFLDSPIQSIVMCASGGLDYGLPEIRASFYRFTCLDDMLRQPVLVFEEKLPTNQTQEIYDLLASPEDLVDTWGPGQFFTSNSTADTEELDAILIGGGVIKPTDATNESNKVFHWSNDIDPRYDSPVRFARKEKIIISGVVMLNQTCQSDLIQRWSSFVNSLENLGTTPGYWQFTEFQAGLALMGQQFAGGQLQFNKTWTWHPGNSWKHQYLALIADDLPLAELDRPWGVLVSACTGVARRVPLRVLLADVLPAFAANFTSTPKEWLKLQPRIITALQKSSGHLKQWHDELCHQPGSGELQSFSRRLIRHILLVLRDTGIDRDHKTFRIACPQGHKAGAPITMCLPVPCEKACLWAQILADTENCATFACMTTQCLESQEHKCQRTTPWHCPSLDTAVQQQRARKDPILMPPQAWQLVINALYWIGSPESGLQAKVVKSMNSPTP